MAFPSRKGAGAWPNWALAILFVVTMATAACEFASPGQPSGMADRSRWGTSAVFTPAHASVGAAVSSFFDSRPDNVEQPFDFSHQIHLSKGAVCTDCHTGVETGPQAGMPSVNTCMICHSQIATDRPLIQQLTEMQAKGLDLAGTASTTTSRRRTCGSITPRTFAPRWSARPVTATRRSRPSPAARST